MANWCEGKLKIRGTRDNIIKFISNCLISQDLYANKLYREVDVGKLYDDNSQKVNIRTLKNHHSFYVDGTTRGFVSGDVSLHFWDYRNTGVEYAVLDFRQAWDIDSKELSSISNKYNIDLKIYAFESGMEFNRDVEVISGNVVKDEVIKFENYSWECIDPTMGG